MKIHVFRVALVVGTVAVLGGAMTLSHRRSVANKKAVQERAITSGSQEQRTSRSVSSAEFQTETLAFERKLVVRLPFSATLIIEQVPEGTSETRATTSLLYRDEAGRTRHDQMQVNSNVTNTPETTTINDPVAGFTYLIQHRNSTTRRTKLNSHADEKSTDSIAAMQHAISAKQRAGSYQTLPVPVTAGGDKGLNQQAAAAAQSESKSESLGEREIEGVATEGTRTTVTIPAGTLGNERAVQIVTERWYSPDLKGVVLIEHSDPRFGKSVYRLTGIQRSAPAPSLFSVPGDYKIIIE